MRHLIAVALVTTLTLPALAQADPPTAAPPARPAPVAKGKSARQAPLSAAQTAKAVAAAVKFARSEHPERSWAALQQLQAREPGLPLRYGKGLDERLKRQPADAEAWFTKGVIACVTGDHDDAVRAFGQAAMLKPGDAQAYALQGFALLEMSSPLAAVKPLETALKLKPDYQFARWLLAQVHFRRGARQEAARLMARPMGSDSAAHPAT